VSAILLQRRVGSVFSLRSVEQQSEYILYSPSAGSTASKILLLLLTTITSVIIVYDT
jgi:hypothetical protein